VLHAFSSGDGTNPAGGVIIKNGSTLLGTTSTGGSATSGTLFSLDVSGSAFTVLHFFSGGDGEDPQGELVLDAAGNVYGTTYLGGVSNYGTVFSLVNQASGAAAVGLGMYVWGADRYSIFATPTGATYSMQVYKNEFAFGTPIPNVTVAQLKRFDFIETRGATPRLVFHNSITSWYTDGTTLTNMSGITNYPTELVQGISYVDGYILVMTTKAIVYNSAIDDPTTWNAADFLTAEIAPGQGVYMSTLINFVACVKQWSIEFLYDAANATGSPFSPYSGSKISIGTGFAETVAALDGAMFLLAQSYSGGYFVAVVENMKPKTISVPAIDRLLSGKALDPLATYGNAFRVDGHAYYMLTLGYTDSTSVTVVYDASNGMWYEWSIVGSTACPFRAVAYSGATPELQHAAEFFIGAISAAYTADWVGNIPMQIQTPIFDGGNTMRKFLRRFELVGDRLPGGTATLLTSDDDYQTWQSQGTIPMDASRNDVWQLGSFRRRAFQINLANATTARVITAELELDEGVR